MDLTDQALALYTPPFRYERGYIWDANMEMVADEVGEGATLRIRGWGRLGKLPNGAALQDELGRLMAIALTELWDKRG